ncbi:MAG: calcium-binding protein [Rickettsiales bacterium]
MAYVFGNDEENQQNALGGIDKLWSYYTPEGLKLPSNHSVDQFASAIAHLTPPVRADLLEVTATTGAIVGSDTAGDHITSTGSNDTVWGNGGNDYITSTGTNADLYAGEGQDIIISSGANAYITGDNGHDIIYARGGYDHSITIPEFRYNVWGGAGNDSIYGGTGDDYLAGGPGNDALFGDAGNDVLHGGLGSDLIDGGEGNDTIYSGGTETDRYTVLGGAGNDLIGGGNGDDRLAGDSVLYYGQGDTIVGDGTDTIFGSLGNDFITGNGGNDILGGDEGNDTVYGGSGNDELYGWTGNDTLIGGNDNDTLYGDQNDDFLAGEAGNNVLYGGDGNDTIVTDISVHRDTAEGGNGTDTFKITWLDTASHLSITDFTAGEKIDFSDAYGLSTAVSDISISENKVLYKGQEIVSVQHGYTLSMNDLVLNRVITGTEGNDDLYADSRGGTIYGLGGDDTIRSYGAGDCYGGDGADTIEVSRNNSVNVVHGGNGNDTLTGGGDYITGTDILYGDSGNDTISIASGKADGGDGNDMIHFIASQVTGGAGRDVFLFNNYYVTTPDSTITDFNVAEDKLGGLFDFKASFENGNTVIDVLVAGPGTGSTYHSVSHITLVGIDANEWSQVQFA